MPKCDINKLQSNFIEITIRHGCSPVSLLHISEHLSLEQLWRASSGYNKRVKHWNLKVPQYQSPIIISLVRIATCF